MVDNEIAASVVSDVALSITIAVEQQWDLDIIYYYSNYFYCSFPLPEEPKATYSMIHGCPAAGVAVTVPSGG